MGLTSDPMAAPSICLWERKYVLFRQKSSSFVMLCTDMLILCWELCILF